MFSFSIDVTKLDKTRFVEGKNGAKYCNLIAIPTKTPGKYGDTHIVKQSASKEEREKGVDLPIIGNGKDFAAIPKQNKPKQEAPVQNQKSDDPLPF